MPPRYIVHKVLTLGRAPSNTAAGTEREADPGLLFNYGVKARQLRHPPMALGLSHQERKKERKEERRKESEKEIGRKGLEE